VIPPRRAAQRNPPFADDKRRATPELSSDRALRGPVGANLPFVLRQRDLLRQINLFPPVQSHSKKYSDSRLTQIKTITPAVPPPRGAFRDRHKCGVGCGGRGQRQARKC
jgi:hypothetical protein